MNPGSPTRYVVELRAPKLGEMFLTNNLTVLAECDYDDFPEDLRWTVVTEKDPT